MSKLAIARDLALPLEAITETIALLGIRGSGKTNTAAVYAEELLRHGQQVVIIDPTDSWWGLKSSADGQSAGFPVVVLGGKHQDLPLASTDGKIVADFVVEQQASVICSLRGFESKQQELRFATDFLRRLYFLKGQQDAPTPIALIIDEASRLVPQRVMGEDAACVGAVQQIVRQGRSSGFGVVLIDQRAATVNKDVLAQLEMLIVHRTTSPQDRKALREWIQQHDTEGREATFLDSLASLKVGEAWVWSPGWLNLFSRVDMRARKTFDSSRTPRAGEVAVTPKKIADVDLTALRDKMAATLEKAKADDPKELRKEIAALEKQLASAPTKRAPAMAVVDQKAIDRAVASAVAAATEPYDQRLATIGRAVTRLSAPLSQLVGFIGGLEAISFAPEAKTSGNGGNGHASRTESVAPNKTVAQSPTRVTPRASSGATQPRGDLSRGQRKILNALAELEVIGVESPGRHQLGMVAGYNLTGGSGARYIADLGKLELARIGDGVVTITDEGRAAATVDDAPTSLAELHERVLRKLSDGQRRIAEHLISIYPDAISRADLGEATGYNLTGGSGAQHVADLVTVGAARTPGSGKVVASALLFPEGLD